MADINKTAAEVADILMTVDNATNGGVNTLVTSANIDDIPSNKIEKPSTEGSNGQVLTTNGAGGVSWTDKLNSTELTEAVSDWLDENVDPTGAAVIVDSTLTISGAAADAKVTGDELGTLRSALSEEKTSTDSIKNDLYIGIAEYQEKKLSDFCTKYAGYNFVAGTYQEKASVSGSANVNYDSYAVFIPDDTKIYIDASDITYYSLTIGTNPDDNEFTYFPNQNAYIVTCESSTRLRKSEGNLPTSESPLSVSAGTVLAFTVTKDTTPKVFMQDDTELFAVDRVSADVQPSKVTIKGTNYTVEFSKQNTTQGYQWNITSLSGKGTNMFPSGVDIVGVIRLADESNFIGGAHGNESNYEFRVLSNGSDISGIGSYEEIYIVMNSHLYNADSPSSNVVDRFVEFVFTSKGWTCRNTFKVLVNAEINAAYCSGLFAFNADDCDGAYTNVGSINLESTSARQLESTEFKEITINLPEDFTVNIHSDTADKGWVTYRDNTDSFKVYFANAQGETVTAGTYITGKCEYRF